MVVARFFLSLLLLLFSFPVRAADVAELATWAQYQAITQKTGRRDFLDAGLRQYLFSQASQNAVASLDAITKYDPSGEIGFCFGRAILVQLMAKELGLKNESIHKLFVIGDLRESDAPEWRFHVATLVRGENGTWYAIDPIMTAPFASGTPLKVPQWIETVQTVWDRKHAAHFYEVDSDAVLPDIRQVPDLSQETGEKIIELSFDPQKHSGFKETGIAGHQVFAVERKAEEVYFLLAQTPGGVQSFSFLGIPINGRLIDYHGFFVDLLADLTSHPVGF